MTTKRPELEDKQAVIKRIHEAARYVPLDNLCLSPQCGFASCEIGNKLTEDEQWAKIALVREIAQEVWGAKLAVVIAAASTRAMHIRHTKAATGASPGSLATGRCARLQAQLFSELRVIQIGVDKRPARAAHHACRSR